MQTWSTLFASLDDEPVRGHPADYRSAGGLAARVRRSTGVCEREFARISSSGDLSELRGAAARQLGEVVGEVDSALSDLPPLFDDLERIFRRHEARLRDLRREVAEALGRANARWDERERSSDTLAAELRGLSEIERQISSLSVAAAADPVALDRLERLETSAWHQRSTVSWAEVRLDRARDDLELSLAEYHRLAATEQDLIDETIRAIGRIDLGDLRDPGRLEQFVTAVVGTLWSVGAGIVDGAIDGLVILAQGLATIAEFVLIEGLRHLAIAIKTALITLAVVVVATAAIATVVVVALAMAVLPPGVGLWLVHQGAELVRELMNPPHTSGDLGGTYAIEPRGRFDVDGLTDRERGQAAIMEWLRHTGDEDQIQQDEFEIIQLDNGKWVVVLPGVIDLSRPNIGLNPHNRSVRDTDQHAVASSTSTGIDGNAYAQMVAVAMRAAGVQPGDEVMILGHSYGADTALDLAADPSFNGPGAYRVTHVAAAAYHSGPQLPSVPTDTNVLVLQNDRDLAVIVESGAHGPTSAFDSFNRGLDNFIDRRPGDGASHLGQAVIDAAGTDIDRRLPVGVETGPNRSHVVFAGGSEGFGHHQNNYIDYVRDTDEASVHAFAESVAQSGYASPGTNRAVDVSVPR